MAHESTGIGIVQRAVIHIGIPIEPLDGISADEPADRRIVNSPVQVHQRKVVQLLLVRIAAVGVVLERGNRVLAQVIVLFMAPGVVAMHPLRPDVKEACRMPTERKMRTDKY